MTPDAAAVLDRFLEVGKILPPGFGSGWMSSNAADLFRIAVFAGFDPKALVLEIYRRRPASDRVNVPTVERAIVALDAADPDHSSRLDSPST